MCIFKNCDETCKDSNGDSCLKDTSFLSTQGWIIVAVILFILFAFIVWWVSSGDDNEGGRLYIGQSGQKGFDPRIGERIAHNEGRLEVLETTFQGK